MIEGENPLETMALDAVIGALGGGAVSGAYGKGVQMVRGSRLRKSGNFRNVKKEGRNFYQDYIQGKYINNVYFGKKGIDETLRWYPQNVKNIPELEYNFKKSVYSGKEELKHARKDDTVHFEVYKNKNNTYLVAVDKKGNKKYYIDKTTSENNTPTQSRGLSESGSNNSIANQVGNFNPVQNKTSQKLRDFAREVERLFRRR